MLIDVLDCILLHQVVLNLFEGIFLLPMNRYLKISCVFNASYSTMWFLFLSLLVIFALFEVRYDTLRRRDKEAVSVYARPIVFLRA